MIMGSSSILGIHTMVNCPGFALAHNISLNARVLTVGLSSITSSTLTILILSIFVRKTDQFSYTAHTFPGQVSTQTLRNTPESIEPSFTYHTAHLHSARTCQHELHGVLPCRNTATAYYWQADTFRDLVNTSHSNWFYCLPRESPNPVALDRHSSVDIYSHRPYRVDRSYSICSCISRNSCSFYYVSCSSTHFNY